MLIQRAFQKSWSASINSPDFLIRCSATNCTSFESSLSKDSNELLFALRSEHYLLLGQREEESQVLKAAFVCVFFISFCGIFLIVTDIDFHLVSLCPHPIELSSSRGSAQTPKLQEQDEANQEIAFF